jgi:chemotaxis protein CheZ
VSTEDDDLEALFDSIAGSSAPEPVAAPVVAPAANAAPSGDLYTQVGQTTRRLHDVLRDIGHDRVSSVADKLKSAIDAVKSAQDSLESGASQLASRWAQLMEGKLSVDEFKALAADTKAYLQDAPAKTKSSNAQLADIDASSVKKLADAAQLSEGQLAQLLIANAPDDKKKGLDNNATTPDQIKTLLGNLGF